MDPVHYSDEEYLDILQMLEQLTRQAEELPYPKVKDLVFSMLQYFDLLHREALSRMMHLLEAESPELLEHLEGDFATRTLLGLYELMETDYPEKPAASNGAVSFVPEQEVRVLTPVTTKQWVEAGHIRNLKPGQLLEKNFGQARVLLCYTAENVFAIQNACLGTALPLTNGILEAHYLICPWHGCRYDLTTGERLDKPGEKITIFPVKVGENGVIKIGLPITHQTQ